MVRLNREQIIELEKRKSVIRNLRRDLDQAESGTMGEDAILSRIANHQIAIYVILDNGR